MTLIETARAHSADVWSREIVPALHDYIRIPNVSAAFDPGWAEHGYMAEAVELIRAWCAEREIAGLTVDVRELPGRTPLIVVDVPSFGLDDEADGPESSANETVILYGHLDKQPEMSGWRDDLGPWTPVVEGDRLYGRGGADDGYAAFASLTAIEAVQRGNGSHHRCIVLIEASEESGSPDLPAHLEALGDAIGSPSLVVCLDSGCLDYERLWVTTSLRGLVGGTLSVEILTEGVHSGEASGVVPSTFRIARQLLDRVEDVATGEVLVPELHVEIPDDRLRQTRATAAEFAEPISAHFPFVDGSAPMIDDPVEQMLNRTWRPTLSVVGAEGLPAAANAGNVLRPRTALKLSFRLPPTCDPEQAAAAIRERLLADPPYGARVTFDAPETGAGWNAPTMAPWLEQALADASNAVWGKPARTFGEGGSIPFMGMLGTRFPEAQFVITGVMGPGTNAHGPNEYLHLPTGERVTAAIALVLDAHARRRP